MLYKKGKVWSCGFKPQEMSEKYLTPSKAQRKIVLVLKVERDLICLHSVGTQFYTIKVLTDGPDSLCSKVWSFSSSKLHITFILWLLMHLSDRLIDFMSYLQHVSDSIHKSWTFNVVFNPKHSDNVFVSFHVKISQFHQSKHLFVLKVV